MSNNPLGLNRDQLSKALGGNYSVIRAFEQLMLDNTQTPATIEEANALAGAALSVAQSVSATLIAIVEMLEQISSIPAQPDHVESDNTMPSVHVGTLGAQNSDAVDITGGTATLESLSVSAQIKSTQPVGLPPFIVASTDLVANLYVARALKADSATSLGTPTSYPPNATDLPTAIALVNALKSAAINKGL